METISKMGFYLDQEVRIISYEKAKEIEGVIAKGQYHTTEGYVFGIDKASWEQVRTREIFIISSIHQEYYDFSVMHLKNEGWNWPEWGLEPIDDDMDKQLILCQFDNESRK